jgi:PadR family transcriptional regulator PadR
VASDLNTQLLKGTLQGCLLILLSHQKLYGYAISEALSTFGFADIPKGTIYPLLLTMEKKQLLKSERQPSPDGPTRKYYVITAAGKQARDEFIAQWSTLTNNVATLMQKEDFDES